MTSASPLRSYRETTGRTLEALGVEIGVNKSTILRWEDSRVPVDRVLEIERITGISRHELRPDVFGQPERASA